MIVDIHRYALESVTLIAVDARMGCLEENLDPRIAKIMGGVEVAVNEAAKLMLELPLYKISPWLSPTYRRMAAGWDPFADYIKVCFSVALNIQGTAELLRHFFFAKSRERLMVQMRYLCHMK
jgi:hypothetical protein